MIVLVDCDGVLADFVGAVLGSYNDRAGTAHAPEDVTQWDIPASLGVPAAELYAEVAEGFCSRIRPYPGAREALDRMREVADVVCLTAGWDAVPTWDYERREWLVREMGFLRYDVVFASGERKSGYAGDLFFDDKYSSVVSWRAANPCGKGVLYRQPWNRTDETDDCAYSASHMASVTRVLATGRD